MPELPDLVRVERVLAEAVVGKAIGAVRVGDPVVLRVMVAEPFPAVLVGRRLLSVERVGQFLRFGLEGEVVLVINAMLTGRYRLQPAAGRKPGKGGDLILALTFEGGSELQYSDETRMGKIYVAAAAQEQSIPGYSSLGVDLLSPGFTLDVFRGLIAKRRDQVRQFLLDKSALAAIGNAYADEILFAAGIHPKTFCHRLSADEVERLFSAIGQTLAWAIAEVEQRGEPIETKVRDFLKVRGRAGKPCVVCGTAIRRVRVGREDACFCPSCQRTDRKLFVDFSKLPGKPPG